MRDFKMFDMEDDLNDDTFPYRKEEESQSSQEE